MRLIGLLLSTIALILAIASNPLPAFAQARTAPIILDGNVLFNVTESGNFTAQQRATEINQSLARVVARDEAPVVTLERVGEIPVIKVNDTYLLSITSADIPDGGDLQARAGEWARTIDKALERARYERTPEYFNGAVLRAVIAAVAGSLLSLLLGQLWQRWQNFLMLRRGESQGNSPSTADRSDKNILALIARILLAVLRIAIALALFFYITRLFPQTRQFSRTLIDTLGVALTSDLFPLGNKSFSILDLLRLLGLIGLLILGASNFRQILRVRVLSLTGLSRAAQETIASISQYLTIFIGTIVVIQLWGLELSSLNVFAGVLGVGVGLGLQGIAKEFISGLALIFERPIQIGDFIEVGELMGTVEHINARSTTIVTLDRVSVIVPNSRFLESEVINWTHRSPISRLKIPVGVAYGSPVETVREILLAAAKEHSEVLSQPAPIVFFKAFGDSALQFQLLVWIREPTQQFRIKSDLYFLIERHFRDRAIEIPFPQRDLNLRSGSIPLDLSPELSETLHQLSQRLDRWMEK
ncbi:mechanosensitive ion channel domain-containing protein [Oscillatoria sp. FACHB-1406]|uniref:mechanosensitive ion channel family protein n=1 Tax=Oscillatoria sp. FACHB-1406 TaxID=2692846 RepID=UPI001685CB28|nr:mechanosensitive ion channel domain-containing protein [Oscillatoria sp. FACHB-1406]MBD2579609.1 mechanosensitive ion channel [Oscillatoria sp. FACHB-1406]